MTVASTGKILATILPLQCPTVYGSAILPLQKNPTQCMLLSSITSQLLPQTLLPSAWPTLSLASLSCQPPPPATTSTSPRSPASLAAKIQIDGKLRYHHTILHLAGCSQFPGSPTIVHFGCLTDYWTISRLKHAFTMIWSCCKLPPFLDTMCHIFIFMCVSVCVILKCQRWSYVRQLYHEAFLFPSRQGLHHFSQQIYCTQHFLRTLWSNWIH